MGELRWDQARSRQIQEAYDDLVASAYWRSPEDQELVARAFEIANEAHAGITRKSGEPYILHPIAVAKIVARLLASDAESIACALLHDVVEDTSYSVDDMRRIFNPAMAFIIEGLTKIDTLVLAEESKQALNFQRLMLSIEGDFRIIFIKLADRLHNMQTLDSMPEAKRQKIASETVYFYAPVADRLGLYDIKVELEDLSFKYRNPTEYASVSRKLTLSRDQLMGRINNFALPVMRLLRSSGIEFKVGSRTKSIYSIWQKMQRKRISFEEVYDLLAMRIVFKPIDDIPEKTQCWFIYTLLTDIYAVQMDRTRDWVSSPKVNGYEALHCTLMSHRGNWVEVQIRTERMDDLAENGFAAHWRYKGEAAPAVSDLLDTLRSQIARLRSTPHQGAVDFVADIQKNILNPQIIVFGPKGEEVALARGSTVLDMAYQVDSTRANTSLGAKVDNGLVRLDHKLQGGERVEFIYAPSQTPSSKWVDYVQTAYASNCIHSFLRESASIRCEDGRLRVQRLCEEVGGTMSLPVLRRQMPFFQVRSLQELYHGVVTGLINMDMLERRLRRAYRRRRLRVRVRLLTHRTAWWIGRRYSLISSSSSSNRGASQPTGQRGITFTQVPCCYALPGDSVIGVKTEEGVVAVHRTTCPEAVRLMAQQGERLVPVAWPERPIPPYLSYLHLEGEDRKGVLANMFSILFSRLEVDVSRVDMKSEEGRFSGVISISVNSLTDLELVVRAINAVQGIRKVYRLENASR